VNKNLASKALAQGVTMEEQVFASNVLAREMAIEGERVLASNVWHKTRQ
jgi:hypothetical protein